MSEKYVLKFVRQGRLLDVLEGSIEEYWYDIYDLFYVSAVLIIQSVNESLLLKSRLRTLLL